MEWAVEDDDVPPSQIMPGVYMGLPSHAKNRGALNEQSPFLQPDAGGAPIRSIVNVSVDEPNHFEKFLASCEGEEEDEDEAAIRFEYHRCPMQGCASDAAATRELLLAAAAFVSAALRRGRPVLLHGPVGESWDRDGSNWAALVLGAYLVHTLRWTAATAVAWMASRRPVAQLEEADVATLASLQGDQVEVAEIPADLQDSLLPLASEVIPSFLWLGGADASTAPALERLEIDTIVNATESVPMAVSSSCPPDQQLRVPLPRTATTGDLLRNWPNTLHFLVQAKAKGRRVLVHCTDGKNRAAAVVMGYLMHAQGLEMSAALREVRQRRPGVKPNAGLAAALQDIGKKGGKNALAVAEVGAAPLAIQDGAAGWAARYSNQALEDGVAQLGELFPVPADVRREALQRHSCNIERAAAELLEWLEGGVAFGSSASATAAGSSSSSSCAAASSSTAGGSSACAGASSSPPLTGANQDLETPECILCGRGGVKFGSLPEAHPDLGWVHDFCLKAETSAALG